MDNLPTVLEALIMDYKEQLDSWEKHLRQIRRHRFSIMYHEIYLEEIQLSAFDTDLELMYLHMMDLYTMATHTGCVFYPFCPMKGFIHKRVKIYSQANCIVIEQDNGRRHPVDFANYMDLGIITTP